MATGATIGANVRRARRAAGLSQETLARELGVSVYTVSRLERDATKRLSVDKLYRVAQALDVKPETLLEDVAA